MSRRFDLWRSSERTLHAAEQLFRTAFENAPIGMALVATDGPYAGCIVRANHALAELVGGDPAQLAGRALSSLAPAEARPELAATLGRLIDGAESVSGEQQLIDAEGHDIWTLLSGSLVQSSHGENGRQAVIQVLDISDRKTFEGRLQHLADHDTLTGLFNRRRFEQELNRSLAHAVRYGSRGALLLLDLDGFKYINDVLGHSVGDELILRVGAVLKGTLRETDIVARIGGDEFAAILPEADAQTAALVAGKLLSAIRRRGSVMSEQREARVTTSIGVTVFDGYRGLTAEDLFVEADIAMYEAKDAGRDGAKIFASEERSREAINVRATWLERLRTAVAEDRLRLFAQPIVRFDDDDADGDVPWFELLLRYEDQYGDLIPPGAFLSIAERFDLITEIDRWVLGEAVRMLHEEHSAGYDVTLAVNLSGKTMDDPGLGDYLASLIAARPIDPGRLVIEVTETAAIVNIERARRLALRLHALGCRLALDDFGAGFSSFYYLKHLAFDYLKIDGEFVRHLAHDTTDQLVIEAVVNIARALGTKTVAEFVGDEGTVDLLRRLGVDYGQGYHFGRPVPVGDVLPAARLGARRAYAARPPSSPTICVIGVLCNVRRRATLTPSIGWTRGSPRLVAIRAEGSVVSDLHSEDRHVDTTNGAIDGQQDVAPSSKAGAGDRTPAHMGDPAPAHADSHRFTRNARERSAEQRRLITEQRLRAAAAREAAAQARDAAALARDQSAELHDRELAARDAWSADGGRALTGADIVMRAAENRRRAAADRAAAAQIRSRSAADRKAAARDRDQAARDRLQAQADRAALLHQLDLAETDALTGVRTRAAGLADLEHEIERARRTSGALVVAYVDVVGLKAVNDARGHTAGDALLQRVAHAIRDHMRCYDLLVRLGGDEFLCAMSGATRDDARQRFRAIREALATGPDRCEIKVGFAALSPQDSADALIRRADAELPVTARGSLHIAERNRE